jgi:hypothetical protein
MTDKSAERRFTETGALCRRSVTSIEPPAWTGPICVCGLIECRAGLAGEPEDLGWHVISGELLLEALRRVAAGENPDLVFAELWANADHESR